MVKKDLLRKIRNEEPLNVSEEMLLDKVLGSDMQEPLRAAVRSLPEEEASMTWRSNLNGRLLELGKAVEKKRNSWLVWRPALGLGVAGVLALMVTLNTHPSESGPQPARSPIEAALIDEHIEASRATEIAGAGLASHEAKVTPVSNSAGWEEDYLFDWEQVDVETL